MKVRERRPDHVAPGSIPASGSKPRACPNRQSRRAVRCGRDQVVYSHLIFVSLMISIHLLSLIYSSTCLLPTFLSQTRSRQMQTAVKIALHIPQLLTYLDNDIHSILSSFSHKTIGSIASEHAAAMTGLSSVPSIFEGMNHSLGTN